MKRLLAIELQKIWKNKASKVLTLTYFILLSFIALFASIKFDIGPFKFHLATLGIFNFPYIWHFNTYFADFFKFFLAIVIVSMMANEYTYGTLKQNLIDGMTKKEFILSKFLTVIILAAGSTFFIFIMSLLLGYSFSSYTELSIVFSGMEYLLGYFVKLLGFFTICLFLGVLIKRSAFAIGFLLLWYVVEGLIWLLLKFTVFPQDSLMPSKIISYFPLNSLMDLVVEPATKLSPVKAAGNQMGIDAAKDYGVHWYAILIVLVWIVIFVLMSYKLLKKRDL